MATVEMVIESGSLQDGVQTGMAQERFLTDLAPSEIEARLRARLGRNLLRTEMRFVGKVHSDGFELRATTDLVRQGIAAPLIRGTVRGLDDGTDVVLSLRAQRRWRIPEYVFIGLGALGAFGLVLSLLVSGKEHIESIDLVLALGVLPFGLLLRGFRRWAERALSSDAAVHELRRLLELRPVEFSAPPGSARSDVIDSGAVN